MFNFLKSKEDKKLVAKRADYYPICMIKYIKKINNRGFTSADDIEVNYCCDNLKNSITRDLFHLMHGANCPPFMGMDYHDFKIRYCPFCGAKIDVKKLKTMKEVEVGCKVIREKAKIIPAKETVKFYHEWKEVKQ